MNKFFLITACAVLYSVGFATEENPQNNIKHPVVEAYAEFVPERLHEHAVPVSPATAAWLERHKRLLGLLVTLPVTLSHWARYWQLAHEELELHNLENLSSHNYVVKFNPDKDEKPQLFKIAGPCNRIEQIKKAHDYYSAVVLPLGHYLLELRKRAKHFNEPLVPENFKRLAKLFEPQLITVEEFNALEKVDTYQTASRLPVYLVCKKIIAERSLEKVAVQPTTLITMCQEHKPTDDCSVIIQEWAENAQEITDANREAISNQAVKELTILICNAGLWELHDLLLRKDGALVVIDTEQPNNEERPKAAFFESASKVNWNVREGLVSFAKVCKDTQKIELILETARQEGALARLEETHTIAGVKALEAEFENLKNPLS